MVPGAGLQVQFHYVGYNESGRRIDSTYLQGRPAETRVGINAMIPGKLPRESVPWVLPLALAQDLEQCLAGSLCTMGLSVAQRMTCMGCTSGVPGGLFPE